MGSLLLTTLPNMGGLPKVSSCCCGCSLKQGTVIIGAVSITFSLLYILMYWASKYLGLGLFEAQGHDDMTKKAHMITMIAMGVISILNVCVNSCLIHGANKAIPKLLLPWLILNGINICLSIINLPFLFVSLQVVSGIISLVFTLIWVYIFVVVSSFKKELENGGQPANEEMAMKA